jgi:hypothetical protein
MAQGALSKEDLLAVWKGSVDPEYAKSLEIAGEGAGYEIPSHSAETWSRISQAIERSTQALYILPWSGQTYEPAGGAAKATVTLTFARTKFIERPLVLGAGIIFVEEETTDFGDDGSVTVRTGRRYTLTEDLVFHPGERGPFNVAAIAEKPGWGYNYPLADTLVAVTQVGDEFTNNAASIDATSQPASLSGIHSSVKMTAENQPDMPIPEHIGQYILIKEGTNAGKVARIIAFTKPDSTSNIGSAIDLEIVTSLQGTVTGTFEVGETIEFGSGIGFGRVLGIRGNKITIALHNGTTNATIAGLSSGATMTSSTVIYGPDAFSDETATAAWRILQWPGDFGLTVTNSASPAGGRLGLLDAIGDDRGIRRATSESDDVYRLRVAAVADTVAPNAIRRALNRTLGGIAWRFLEVGHAELPGFFFDVDDAYDYDTIAFTGTVTGTFTFQEPVVLETTATGQIWLNGWFGRLDGSVVTFIRRDGTLPTTLTGLRLRGTKSGATLTALTLAVPSAQFPNKRYNVWLDYEQFRAFFIIEIIGLAFGEFGAAYDVHPFDAFGSDGFFDGFPYLAADVYKRVRQAMEDVHAGGVGFILVKQKTNEATAT